MILYGRQHEGGVSKSALSTVATLNTLASLDLAPRLMITFHAGAQRYERAATRLSKSWIALGAEHYAASVRLEDLPTLPNVTARDVDFIRSHQSQAFGFWIWKPLIIEYFAATLVPGLRLCYIDAGCEINRANRSKDRLDDYWDIASSQSVAAFESDFLACEYTKSDIYTAMKFEPDPYLLQLAATCIFLVSGSGSSTFCSEWLSYCRQSDYHLIDDSPSHHVRDRTLCEHRYDQSVMSALYTHRGLASLPNEIYFGHGYWKWRNEGKQFPIWASRNTRGLPLYAWRRALAWIGWIRYEMQRTSKQLERLHRAKVSSGRELRPDNA